MARIKPKRKSTHVDMTPFVDVAFLLLTFFILAAQFRPEEAVKVTTPASTATEQIPEGNLIEITMDGKGRIFFGMAGQNNRIAMLENLAKARKLTFTDVQKKKFSLLHNFGTPINELKSYLKMNAAQRDQYNEQTKGIPVDTSGVAKNQLEAWLKAALTVHRKAPLVVKGDKQAKYPVFNAVINTLKDVNENKFQLVTSGSGGGAGSAITENEGE